MEKICCCLALLLSVISLSSANVCTKPEVSAQSYTTPDATILTNIGFVAEFSLKCSNGVQNPALFAELGGKTQPVAHIGPNKYQVRNKYLYFSLSEHSYLETQSKAIFMSNFILK